MPSSEALTDQTDRGARSNGFDFYRDPLGASRPGMTFDDFYRAGVANKAQVAATQRKILESRYNLEPRLTRSSRCRAANPSRWVLQRDCRRG